MKLSENKTFILATFLIFLLDQITKELSLYFLEFEKEYIVNHLFSLRQVYNEGTIMAIFHLPFGLTVSQFRFVYVLNAVILSIAIWWTVNQPAMKYGGWIAEFGKCGLFLFLGGILGNGFDRTFRDNGVIDFLQLNFFGDDSMPIINFADLFIYIGEASIVLGWMLIFYKELNKKFKKINSLDAH